MKGLFVIVCLAASLSAISQTPPPSADQKQLTKLEAQYDAAKLAYKHKPNAANKHLLVVAADQLATATMTSEVLDARARYPKALGLYQDALTLEPKNKEAANNASMIDSVYHGMIAKAKLKLQKDPTDAAAKSQLARLTGIYSKIHRPLP